MGDPNNSTEFEIGYFLGTYIIIRVVIKGVKIILKNLKFKRMEISELVLTVIKIVLSGIVVGLAYNLLQIINHL